MVLFRISTISDNIYWNLPYFHEKVLKKYLTYSKLPHPLPGQEWARKLTVNILQENFAPLLLVTIFNTLPVFMKVLHYILSIFQHVTMHYHQFFKKISSYTSFLRNSKVIRGNSLKMTQICIYFTENVR